MTDANELKIAAMQVVEQLNAKAPRAAETIVAYIDALEEDNARLYVQTNDLEQQYNSMAKLAEAGLTQKKL